MSDRARQKTSSGVVLESAFDHVDELADAMEAALRVRRAALEALERELSEFLLRDAGSASPRH